MRIIKQLLAMLLSVSVLLTCLPNMPVLATGEITSTSSDEVTVVGLTCQDVTIIENTNGYWNTDYFYYSWLSPKFTVMFSDGTVYRNQTSGVQHKDKWYYLEILTNQSVASPWEIGEHTATAKMGDVSTEFKVTIEESPIIRIEANDLEIIENTDGYYSTGYDPASQAYKEYYYYYAQTTVTIYYKDGTVQENARYLDYNGTTQWCNYEYSVPQNYENQWQVGDIHEATVSLCGYEDTYEVSIIESPVESIVCEDVALIEETGGYYNNGYNSELQTEIQYFYYSDFLENYTVYFKNGSKITSEGSSGIEYNGHYYYPQIETDQSAETPWEIGTHEATVSLLGAKNSVVVNIIETPIESITCHPLEVYEETDGSWTGDWEFYEHSYYHYNLFDLKFNVKFKDGTELKNVDSNFLYNKYQQSIRIDSEQSLDNPWTAGNSYNAIVSFMGAQASADVTILESPIESIEIGDMEIIENTNGAEGYYGYHYYNLLPKVKVHLRDGGCEELTYSGFYYEDINYSVRFFTEQSYDTPWDVGEHVVTAVCGGATTTFTVNVVETPYVSLEILNVTPLTEDDIAIVIDGNVIYDIPDFTYRITDKNGESFVGYYGRGDKPPHWNNATGNWWADYESIDDFLTVSSDQEERPWTVDGENYFTVSYTGLEARVKAEFLRDDINRDFEYYEEDGGIYVTGCNKLDETVLTIPSKINGKPVVGVLDLGFASEKITELHIPDSVEQIASWSLNGYRLEKIYIGSGVSYLDCDMFGQGVKAIHISEKNPFYSSQDGIVYDKEQRTLVIYPFGRGNEYEVPTSVTNIDVLYGDSERHWNYRDMNFTFPNGSDQFVKQDGVLYADKMTKILNCDINKSGEYIMPESVTSINAQAFVNCDKLTKVVISDKVTEIAYGTFAECTSLVNVKLPDNLVKIDELAFSSCEALENVSLPTTLKSIGEYGFAGSGLKEIYIPDNVVEIGKGAFQGWNLKKAVIGNGLIEIPDYVFYSQPLTSVTIGESVTSIGECAFEHVELKEIEIPSSVRHIGEGAFAYCYSLQEIQIPDSVTYLGEQAFMRCQKLNETTIGAGVSKIEQYTFAYCDNLETVVFKHKAVEIGREAFLNCPIKNINLENVSGEIGKCAFGSGKMTEVTLSEGVTRIMYDAFLNCAEVTKIDIPASLRHIDVSSFEGTAWYESQVDGLVYLEHTLYNYKGAMPKNTAIDVKKGTTVLADRLFRNQQSLKEITLPEGLLTIGYQTFQGCIGLSEIEIPSTVEYIDAEAFAGCTGLRMIKLPASIKYLDKNALPLSTLESIEVDQNNEFYSSKDGVLYNKDRTELILCPSRKDSTFIVPDTVTYIWPNAFTYSGVTTLVVTNPTVTFGEKAFGYELIKNSFSNAQYLESSIVCNEESSAYIYAKDNLIPVEKIVSFIDVKTMPDKLTYLEGKDMLDVTGGVITLHYEDGTTSDVLMSNDMILGFDNSTQGSQLLTVTYQGTTATFSIEIKAKEVISISVETVPDKNLYVPEDTTLDLAGGKLHVSYNNDTEAKIDMTEDMISGFVPGQVGNQTITVTFGGKTSSFDVKVTDALIKADNVIGALGNTIQVPIKMTYNPGINYLNLQIEYDSSALQLVSVENQGLLTNSMYQASQSIDKNPYVMLWASAAQSSNVGDVVILTFNVLEDAVEGKYPITITCNEAYNQNNEDVLFDVISPIIDVREAEAGDANADGDINGKDATLLLQYLAGWDVEVCISAADVNGDGIVNGKDVTMLLKYLVGDI